jgi:quinoprotein glucose dehydrogenase
MSLVPLWVLTVAGTAAVIGGVALRTTDAHAQASQAGTASRSAEWRFFGADAGATRYSPLNQIRADNVGKLEVAWRWSARNQGPEPPRQMQVSPLVIDGILYTTAGNQRNVVAIDAATGETLWQWRPGENERRWATIIEPVARSAGRGVTYWTDGARDQRIFVVTPSYQLVALDARTGKQIEGFGVGGVVDMVENLRWDKRPGANKEGRVSNTSPPSIIGNVLVASITGHTGSVPTRSSPNEVWPMNLPEDVVAYDVRTGKRLWRFHTVPEAREFGSESWLKAEEFLWNVPVGTHSWVKEHPELLDASWKYTGNVGFWAPVTADPELGYFFIATESPTNDYYGGYRPGENLFGNSVLALKAETGELMWHYQITHHELWDYDIPTAPMLLDIEVNGTKVKALAQIVKQGFVYVLDRQTGKPIWPVEERKVPKSDIPGEWTSPTQPHSSLSFDRQGISENDLIDYTPALRAEALKAVAPYRMGALYTPPSLVNAPDGTKGTLTIPGGGGVANWPGGAVDPETGMLYVTSATSLGFFGVMDGTPGTGVRYHIARPVPNLSIQGLPLFKPPYSRITAIDLKTGKTRWAVPNGDTPDVVKNHPALQNVKIPKTGTFNRSSGLLVTSTLLFTGEGSTGAPILWAYDKMTGNVVGKVDLPGPTTGFPITYMKNGKQFIVVAARAGDAVELVALALPE